MWGMYIWGMRLDGANKAFIKECLFQDFFQFHLAESQISYQKKSQESASKHFSPLQPCLAPVAHTASLTSYREEGVTSLAHPFRACPSGLFMPPFQIPGLFLRRTFKEKALFKLSSFAFQTILFRTARLFIWQMYAATVYVMTLRNCSLFISKPWHDQESM